MVSDAESYGSMADVNAGDADFRQQWRKIVFRKLWSKWLVGESHLTTLFRTLSAAPQKDLPALHRALSRTECDGNPESRAYLHCNASGWTMVNQRLQQLIESMPEESHCNEGSVATPRLSWRYALQCATYSTFEGYYSKNAQMTMANWLLIVAVVVFNYAFICEITDVAAAGVLFLGCAVQLFFWSNGNGGVSLIWSHMFGCGFMCAHREAMGFRMLLMFGWFVAANHLTASQFADHMTKLFQSTRWDDRLLDRHDSYDMMLLVGKSGVDLLDFYEKDPIAACKPALVKSLGKLLQDRDDKRDPNVRGSTPPDHAPDEEEIRKKGRSFRKVMMSEQQTWWPLLDKRHFSFVRELVRYKLDHYYHQLHYRGPLVGHLAAFCLGILFTCMFDIPWWGNICQSMDWVRATFTQEL